MTVMFRSGSFYFPCSEPHHRCSWPLPSFPQRHSRAGAWVHVCVCPQWHKDDLHHFHLYLSVSLEAPPWGSTPLPVQTESHDIPTMNIPPFSGHWDATDEDSSRRRRREHLGRKEEVMRRARRLKDRAEGKRREGEVISDPGVLLWSTWNWRAWNTCSLWQMLSRALSLCVSRLPQVTAGNTLSNRRETRLNSWFTYISITLKLGWFQSCQGTV